MTSDLYAKTVDLDASLKELGHAIDRKLEELDELRDRLHLIIQLSLDRIDGDSSSDTHWSEIVGIAKGDANWLQHARASYDVDHARLVTLSRTLVESVIDSLPDEGPIDEKWKAHEAECIADNIEQEILPAMQIAEDGRTFLRGQGQAYPPEPGAERAENGNREAARSASPRD